MSHIDEMRYSHHNLQPRPRVKAGAEIRFCDRPQLLVLDLPGADAADEETILASS